MVGLFNKLKNKVTESSPELFAKASAIVDKGKEIAEELNEKSQPHLEKAKQVVGELAEKAQPHLDKAKQATDELTEKAAPVLKAASENAKKNTGILKEQTFKVLGEEAERRKQLKLKTEQDADAHHQYITSMYDTLLTPDSAGYISERFNHYDRFLNFMAITGKVLSTEKRSEFNIDTRYSSDASGYGFSYKGTGFSSMSVSNSFHLGASTTTAHEFWLKLPEGTEAPFYIGDSSVPLREGQTVTLIFASDNDDIGSLILVHNHNANAVWEVMSPKQLAQWSSLYKIEQGFFIADKKEKQNKRVLEALTNKFKELKQWSVNFSTNENLKLPT